MKTLRSCYATLFLVSLSGCAEKEAAKPDFEIRAFVTEAGVPQRGALAIAWSQAFDSNEGDQLRIDPLEAEREEDGVYRLSLDGPPNADTTLDLESFEAVDDHAFSRLTIGHIVLVADAATQQLPRYDPWPTELSVIGDEMSLRQDIWCAPACISSLWCEGLCHRETHECVGADERADCKLSKVEGNERYRHVFGATDGIATDYLVFYASDAISAQQLAYLGFYEGPLEPGYHLVRARALTGAKLEESKACWRGVFQKAVEQLNAEKGTHYESARDVFDGESRDDAQEVSSFAYYKGMGELHCPYPHIAFELAPNETAVKVSAGSTLDPVFDVRTVPIYLGGSYVGALSHYDPTSVLY